MLLEKRMEALERGWYLKQKFTASVKKDAQHPQ